MEATQVYGANVPIRDKESLVGVSRELQEAVWLEQSVRKAPADAVRGKRQPGYVSAWDC